jgi:hypothetical protein
LIEIVTALMTRQVGLKRLNDPIDTTKPQGGSSSTWASMPPSAWGNLADWKAAIADLEAQEDAG